MTSDSGLALNFSGLGLAARFNYIYLGYVTTIITKKQKAASIA